MEEEVRDDSDAGDSDRPLDASRVFDVTDEEREIAAAREAARAERTVGMIRQGRRIGGMPGAMMAGAMAALRDIYEGPPKEEIPEVQDWPDEPHDVDRDGVSMSVGEVDVASPAQPRTSPVTVRRTSRRRRRR